MRKIRLLVIIAALTGCEPNEFAGEEAIYTTSEYSGELTEANWSRHWKDDGDLHFIKCRYNDDVSIEYAIEKKASLIGSFDKNYNRYEMDVIYAPDHLIDVSEFSKNFITGGGTGGGGNHEQAQRFVESEYNNSYFFINIHAISSNGRLGKLISHIWIKMPEGEMKIAPASLIERDSYFEFSDLNEILKNRLSYKIAECTESKNLEK